MPVREGRREVSVLACVVSLHCKRRASEENTRIGEESESKRETEPVSQRRARESGG